VEGKKPPVFKERTTLMKEIEPGRTGGFNTPEFTIGFSKRDSCYKPGIEGNPRKKLGRA